MIARKTKGVNSIFKALGSFWEQVIKMSIVEGTEKMGGPPLPRSITGKKHQDSKAVVDEPFSKTSAKECQIDLKKKNNTTFPNFQARPHL